MKKSIILLVLTFVSCQLPWGYGGITGYDESGMPTGVVDPGDWVPQGVIEASLVYPNPTHDFAILIFKLSEHAEVKVVVNANPLDVVKVLISGQHVPGVFSVTWDLTDNQGRKLSPGTYRIFIRATDSQFKESEVYGDIQIEGGD